MESKKRTDNYTALNMMKKAIASIGEKYLKVLDVE
jgi:hypothetical protein